MTSKTITRIYHFILKSTIAYAADTWDQNMTRKIRIDLSIVRSAIVKPVDTWNRYGYPKQ